MKRYLIITLTILFAFSTLAYAGPRGVDERKKGSNKKGKKQKTVSLNKNDKKLVKKALNEGFESLTKEEKENLQEILSATFGIKIKDKKNSGSSNK